MYYENYKAKVLFFLCDLFQAKELSETLQKQQADIQSDLLAFIGWSASRPKRRLNAKKWARYLIHFISDILRYFYCFRLPR